MIDKQIYMDLNHVIEICNWCKNANIECEECNQLYGACRRNMAILDLEKHFESEDQPWIPCSERLPEEEGSYLLTSKTASGISYVRPGLLYSDGKFGNHDRITAWMPMPLPYQKGE